MRRIYKVTDGEDIHLVRAANRAQALTHVAKGRRSLSVATQEDLVGALATGVAVEDAGPDVPLEQPSLLGDANGISK